MSTHYNPDKADTIVPFSTRRIETLLSLREVIDALKGPFTRSDLERLFTRYANTYLSSDRLEWYTTLGIFHYTLPTAWSLRREKYGYLINEKVRDLLSLLSSIDDYGLYSAERMSLHVCQYYQENNLDIQEPVSVKTISEWFGVTKQTVGALIDRDGLGFCESATKSRSALVRHGPINKTYYYRPSENAERYLHTWFLIRDWIDENKAVKQIAIPTPRDWIYRTAHWA